MVMVNEKDGLEITSSKISITILVYILHKTCLNLIN
jgi:hypothetical protein